MANFVLFTSSADAVVQRTATASMLVRVVEVSPARTAPDGGNFVTVAGIQLDVQVGGASELAGRTIGHEQPAFSGRLLSTRRGHKSEWRFTVGPVLREDYFALRTAVRAGYVECFGPALELDGDLVILCSVALDDGGYTPDRNWHQRTAAITIKEV